MKYWRGYLTAAVIGLFTWGLIRFAQSHSALVDMVYPYVTRIIQGYLSQWSGSVAYCLWQVLLVAFVLGVLASVVLMVIFRWNPIQWFGWIAAAASLVFFLHTGIYGLNYYAGPIEEDIRLEVTPYTVAELREATQYYRDKANALSGGVTRDEQNRPQYAAFAELAEQAGEGFTVLVYEQYMPVFAGITAPVKELGWADLYTSMGITGVTMPVTGEAAVNPQIPPVSLPFTMCHEMAHRMCIAVERDANMAAFLACRYNPSPEFQYSAYYMAYRYCLTALSGADAGAARQIAAGENVRLQQDMREYDDFFAKHRDEEATQVANTVNDTYIQASGDEQGIASYGDVCDLLVNWHIQKVVLPSQVEEGTVFDPMDESQVDLTGTVHAGAANG